MVYDYFLRRVSVAAMNTAQLLILALCMLTWFIGYKTGHRDGYIVGRKAVRKHYDSIEKVRV